MLVLADALLDVALGKRRLAGARIGGVVLRRRTVIGSKRKLTLCLPCLLCLLAIVHSPYCRVLRSMRYGSLPSSARRTVPRTVIHISGVSPEQLRSPGSA